MPLAGKSAVRIVRLRELAEGFEGERRSIRLERVEQLQSWRRRLKAVVPVLGVLLGPKR